MWYRIQEILFKWYEYLVEDAKKSTVLHADESGLRVNGQTNWLWCFTNGALTYLLIVRSRGSTVLFDFLGEVFNVVLTTYFWRTSGMIHTESLQYCLSPLIREIHDVDEQKDSEDSRAFIKKIRQLLGDAHRLLVKRVD